MTHALFRTADGRIRSPLSVALILCFTALLAACQTASTERQAYASPKDQMLAEANDSFTRGDYGLSEEKYRQGLMLYAGDPSFALGLAATYDHLKRFDLSNEIYKKLLVMYPKDATILNNYGYSLTMQGQAKKAAKVLQEAAALDPSNATIQGNLKGM